MTKKFVMWLSLGVIILLCIFVTVAYNWNNITIGNIATKTKLTDTVNVWIALSSTEKDSIKVTYQEKYGIEKTLYCSAIFENNKTGEYKCVAPWLGNIVLQKSNLNSFTYNKK
jgi:hypothetical protein